MIKKLARSTSRRTQLTPAEKAQRASFRMLRDELIDLHLLSVEYLYLRGVLPPIYGGEHLGDLREAIPLWGYNDENDTPALSIMLMRLVPEAEPNADLRQLREVLDLENDWPVSELMETLFGARGKQIGGLDRVASWSVFLVLAGDQLQPAPGYDRGEMLDHIAQMRPYAIFPFVPISVEGEEPVYHWDDIESLRAEVVYAESPEMLEAAVWDYRLQLALNNEAQEIITGGQAPEDELVALTVSDLVGMYELMAMGVSRFYGTTSPLRAQQEKYDVLREENGDLLVRAPVKAEIEPVFVLAESRKELDGSAGQVILHIDGSRKPLDTLWPQIRASRFFCLRMRQGMVDSRKWRLRGYAPAPYFEWLMADEMRQLHRLAHLFSLYEFLSLCGVVKRAEHLAALINGVIPSDQFLNIPPNQ